MRHQCDQGESGIAMTGMSFSWYTGKGEGGRDLQRKMALAFVSMLLNQPHRGRPMAYGWCGVARLCLIVWWQATAWLAKQATSVVAWRGGKWLSEAWA